MNSSSFLGLGDLGISFLGIDVDIGADSEWISKGSASSNFRTNTLKNTLVKSSGIANLAWSSSFFKNSETVTLGVASSDFKTISYINSRFVTLGTDKVIFDGQSVINLKMDILGKSEVLFKTTHIRNVVMNAYGSSEVNLIGYHYYNHLPFTHRLLIRPEELRKVLSLIENRNSTHGIKGRTTIRNIENYTEMVRYFK